MMPPVAIMLGRVREAKLVILADADLTEEVIQWIESIRGERCYLVRSDRKVLTYEAKIIDGSRNEGLGMRAIHSIIQQRQKNHNLRDKSVERFSDREHLGRKRSRTFERC